MVTIALIVVVVILTIVVLVTLWRVRGLTSRLEAALGGTEPQSLETTLANHLERVRVVDSRLSELSDEYQRLSAATALASQKISLVRFNPFGDTGGDQSFSLAVLDAHHSGYVLSSIHGREGTRMYVKPIDFGTSKYPVSEEEKQAIAQAMKRVPPKQAKED